MNRPLAGRSNGRWCARSDETHRETIKDFREPRFTPLVLNLGKTGASTAPGPLLMPTPRAERRLIRPPYLELCGNDGAIAGVGRPRGV
jgi:hypothetical protein